MLSNQSEEDTLNWIRTSDELARADRLARIKYLRSLYPAEQDTLLFGGVLVPVALHEMQLAYVFGLDLACVLSAQVVLEHLLDGVLNVYAGAEREKSGLYVLAQNAFDLGFISSAEHQAIDSLRKLRNPYTHPQPVMSDGCMIRRQANSGLPTETIIQRDAEQAIATVIGLITRAPFAFPREASLHDNQTSTVAPD